MARTQTMVQLNEDLLELLDDEAARSDLSRSALIRTILDYHFQRSSERRKIERLVDGYRRIPPSTPDEWGDLEESAETATLETLERLDAEEREAGLEPW